MKHFIYADNAATTKLDPLAFEAMKPYLLEEYGNPSQAYAFARPAKKAIAEARNTIAACINADPSEIIFTSGGTESDNWAIKGSAFSDVLKRAIITSQIEHHAVLRACESIERMGYPVAYLKPNAEGLITPFTLQSIITDRTQLVSIMYANNEIGTIEPIKDLAKIAHSHGALFHTDAVQAVGHVNINVHEMDVDMLSASAHKFNGPKGIGFLYIKKGVELMPHNNGGDQEFGSRAGTENVAAIVGMAVSLKNNVDRIAEHIEHITGLERRFIECLNETGLDYVRNGAENHLPGNISLSFKDADGEMLLHRLDLMGICVSTGAACDSKETQVSHVLNAIGLDGAYARGTIRITLGKDNTVDEVERIVAGISKILKA